MRFMFALAALAALSGCAIRQDVRPVTFAPTAAREVCIIEHSATRAAFLDEYRRVLESRGFQTRVLPEHSPTNSCHVTSTYVARWSWDLTIYMSYAELHVFDDGREVGHAIYDSRLGGARLDKFVDAETKIAELVDQLFVQQR